MIAKITKSLRGFFIMLFCVKRIVPKKLFSGKRVAVIGAADSALELKNGQYIDSFDLVIRINKALTSWNSDNCIFIGSKTNVLFHSFYENTDRGGGGKLNLQLFSDCKVRYLIQPRSNAEGWRVMFNFYKKYLKTYKVYTFRGDEYKRLEYLFKPLKPTVGFCALYSVLTSKCDEVFITGFTFFKTPYAKGYRDHLLNMEANKKHISNQGQHDPDLEYEQFKNLLSQSKSKKVVVDQKLFEILQSDGVDIPILNVKDETEGK